MYLSIYICIYIFINLFFIFALCGLGPFKIFLQVASPHMIFHCKYLAILYLLAYTKICKIMKRINCLIYLFIYFHLII